jgi:diguanylate cyclase (GGDEF)-like protein
MGRLFAVAGLSEWRPRSALAELAEQATVSRVLAGLFAAGSTLALAAMVVLTMPAGTSIPGSLTIVAMGYCAAVVLLVAGDRLSALGIQGFLAFGTVCVTLGMYFSGDLATDNQMFYLWVGLFAGLFLSRKAAAMQLAFVGLAYGAELAILGAGSEGVVHWLVTMGTLTIAASLVAGMTDRAAQDALYDPLTSLPRREVLLDRLQRSLHRGRGGAGGRTGVAVVSIDRYDTIAQRLGPDGRDRLLALTSGRVRSSVRAGDTVAHIGDGSFAVLLDPSNGALGAAQTVERISERLRAPFLLTSGPLSLSASIGLTFDGGETDSASELMRTADAAVARARGRAGADNAVDGRTAGEVAQELEVQADLRRAIDNDELEVHYQPKVSLRTGRVLGAEALVRWRHPRRGLIGPGEFISCAETTGAIVPLGRTVLRRACRQARAWQTLFPSQPPFKVFVNVSSRQLQDDELVHDVSDALAESHIEPGGLALELTESAVSENLEQTAHTLRRLKAMGVWLAVDDFGVGYSSLGLLRHLPLDALKIDRSFVARMLDGPEDEAIVSAVVTLAKALRLQIVAEGVERHDQLERLRELGCDVAQGFYFARPLPAREAGRAISARA